MIRRFYVHNFRCLENFELPLAGKSSVLLIGRNGSGKSTVGLALEVLQRIARGTNRAGELVTPRDLSWEGNPAPMRFEMELELNGIVYEYVIAFELPEGFKELRAFEERFAVGGTVVYSREKAQVTVAGSGKGKGEEKEAKFLMDWHLVALPIVHQRSERDPLATLKRWLAQMLILRPIPRRIGGQSSRETLEPDPELVGLAEWFSGVVAHAPAAYATIASYRKQVMPDLKEIRNPKAGRDSRSLEVEFANGERSLSVPFEVISDGEKCFLICAVALAANQHYGPLLCFWDEPDSHLALSEVGHFVMDLRKSFQRSSSQLLIIRLRSASLQTRTRLCCHGKATWSRPGSASWQNCGSPWEGTLSRRSSAETWSRERQQVPAACDHDS